MSLRFSFSLRRRYLAAPISGTLAIISLSTCSACVVSSSTVIFGLIAAPTATWLIRLTPLFFGANSSSWRSSQKMRRFQHHTTKIESEGKTSSEPHRRRVLIVDNHPLFRHGLTTLGMTRRVRHFITEALRVP